MKAPSPLLGFNNNFKHKGAVYHVQTEDSGVKHPHIITHLFADGGRILKSIKTSYAQYVNDPRMAEIVRQMMKEQHKAMIIALRDGRFDPGGSREVDLPTTGYFADVSSPGLVRKADAPPSSRDPKPASSPSPSANASPPAPPSPSSKLDVDPTTLEKAAASAAAAAPAEPAAARPQVTAPSTRPQAQNEARSPSARPSKPPTGRYAMTRPASIFATSKPSPTRGSLFGEDLISERSLDEVILAYLAEDLEGEKK